MDSMAHRYHYTLPDAEDGKSSTSLELVNDHADAVDFTFNHTATPSLTIEPAGGNVKGKSSVAISVTCDSSKRIESLVLKEASASYRHKVKCTTADGKAILAVLESRA